MGRVMFAELHMLSGERQESSDLVGVATSPVFSLYKRRRGQLFTVAEPSLPQAEALCRRLVETIENEYFSDSTRSVTTALRQSLVAANELLRIENSKATPDRQLRVGICCAAVRDDCVYVAQVAPANAFILHAGMVKKVFTSYSEVPDAGSNGTHRASDALGAQLEPQVNFGYSPLDEGDLVVLATGANWKLIPERYIQEAARQVDPEMAATELYRSYTAHVRRPTTSLIVIRVSELPGSQRGNGNGKAVGELSGPLKTVDPSAGGKNGKDGPDHLGAAPPRPKEEELARGRLNGTPREKPCDDAVSQGVAKKAGSPQPTPEVSARRSSWGPLKLLLRRGSADQPLQPPSPPLERVGRPLVTLKQPKPWTRPERSGRLKSVATLVLMLALAALFVAAGNTGVNLWRSRELSDAAVLVQQARDKQAQSAAAENETAARGQLAQAQELLARAQRVKNDEPTRALAASVQADLDRIDRVVRVAQTNVVVDFAPIFAEKGEVTRVLLDGSNLYALDEGQDRIFKYSLTPDGKGVQDPGVHPVLVKRGDKVDGSVVGDLLSMTWMPAGQLRTSPALFALESGRAIISVDPNGGLSRIEVGENNRWGSIQAIGGFAGGLYLLDTKQKAVYYYPPTKNGYESEPYIILDSNARSDLSKAVDIALDGNLYVLTSDGSISRYTREGRPLDFAGQLPDGPLKEPRSLFASANTRSLYAVDGQGERIVQFSPEGKLQRQFKADGKSVSFSELRSVFVDEASRKIYALARKSLQVFDTPPME